MKMNPSKLEVCEQVATSSTSSDGIEHVKSYTCSFCKRGFLNAQALGGHMNIHRKDRARLRDSSFNPNEENLLQINDEKSTNLTLKRPWIFVEEADACSSPNKKDGIGELLHLPLFVEKPSTVNIDQEETSACVGSVSSVPELELDLELRLGRDISTKDSRDRL